MLKGHSGCSCHRGRSAARRRQPAVQRLGGQAGVQRDGARCERPGRRAAARPRRRQRAGAPQSRAASMRTARSSPMAPAAPPPRRHAGRRGTPRRNAGCCARRWRWRRRAGSRRAAGPRQPGPSAHRARRSRCSRRPAPARAAAAGPARAHARAREGCETGGRPRCSSRRFFHHPARYSSCSGTSGLTSQFCARVQNEVSGSTVRITSFSSSIVSHSSAPCSPSRTR